MFLALFLLFAVASARDLRGEVDLSAFLGGLPMQNPDLFGGDMLVDVDVTDRNVIPQESRRWTNAVVPYVIDPSLSGYKNLIEGGMQDYHQKTCIRFVHRTSESNYIRIFAGRGCYSSVGMIGGLQQLSLGQGCMFQGTVVHELGHALGFWHEQNRSDRDQYLIIYWQNIQQGMEGQFFLLKPNENLLLSPFDHNSIMIYGNNAFSKDGRSNTMEAKNGVKLLNPYDKQGLADSDVTRLKQMYNCQ